MAGPTIDTMSISDVSYESGVLTLKITTGYGMKNPDFIITPTGKTPIAVSRSGYLSNPYTLTLTTSGVAAGDTCTIDATYMDSADSGTSLTASANFTIPAPLVPDATLSCLVGATGVRMTATSVVAGAGDMNVTFLIRYDNTHTSSVASRSGPFLLSDGGTASATKTYTTGSVFQPGETHLVELVDAANESNIYDSYVITIPHYTTKVFKEWQRNGVAFDFSTPVTEDITLVGAWNEVYQVTFKDYDDSVISTQNVVQGSATGLIMPPDPTRSGYTFAGWECSLDGHIWNNATEDVISEMTLKATYTTT